MTLLRIFLFEHDLFGKPVSAFPDHALAQMLGLHLPQWSPCVSTWGSGCCRTRRLIRRGSEASFHLRCGGRMGRRNEAKDSATWRVRARPQSSVMRFDNRPADRQSKPQTARFRGVERLEHALKSRRREAWTRIPYLD